MQSQLSLNPYMYQLPSSVFSNINIANLFSEKTSPALMTLGFETVQTDLVTMQFNDYGVQRSLRINGTLHWKDSAFDSLFRTLGLSETQLSFVLWAYPWPASKLSLSQPANLKFYLFLALVFDVQISSDIKLQDVEILIQTIPQLLVTVAGTWLLQMPGESAPLLLRATLTAEEGSPFFFLSANTDDWVNPFGIAPFLVIDTISLSASLSTSSVDSLTIVASWTVSDSLQFQLFGETSHAFSGVVAYCRNLTVVDFAQMLNSAFGVSFTPSESDFVLYEATIAIGKGTGFLNGIAMQSGLSVYGKMDILDWQNLEVFAQINKQGVFFAAAVPDLHIDIPGVTIHAVTLALQLHSKKAADPNTYLVLSANTTIDVAPGLAVEFAILVNSNPSGGKTYAVMGEIDNFSLSRIIPGIPSALDLSIPSLTFSYIGGIGSKTFTGINLPAQMQDAFGYLSKLPPVGSGLQISAQLSHVPFVEFLGLSKAEGILQLQLGGTVETLYIHLVLEGMSFSRFQCADIALFARMGAESSIGFQLTMSIVLPRSAVPTVFSAQLSFVATPPSAKITATMQNSDPSLPAWPSAFGLNGLDIFDLGFTISYTPPIFITQIGFQGGIRITERGTGRIHFLNVAVVVGANPGQELLDIHIIQPNFGVFVGLIELFTGPLAEVEEIADIIEEFEQILQVDEFQFYFSEGVNFGTQFYPPGGQMYLSTLLFGKYPVLQVNGTIQAQSGSMQLTGHVPGLNLGLVAVKGDFGFAMSPTDQNLWVSGVVDILGFNLEIYINICRSHFQFQFELELMPGFSVGISATADGVVTDPAHASFKLSGALDVSGISGIFMEEMSKCMPLINDALDIARTSLDQTKKIGLASIHAVEDSYREAAKAVERGWTDVSKLLNQKDQIKDRMAAALNGAESGINAAHDVSELILANTKKAAQAAEDGAAKAVQGVTAAYDKAIGKAGDAVNYALYRLEHVGDFVRTFFSFSYKSSSTLASLSSKNQSGQYLMKLGNTRSTHRRRLLAKFAKSINQLDNNDKKEEETKVMIELIEEYFNVNSGLKTQQMSNKLLCGSLNMCTESSLELAQKFHTLGFFSSFTSFFDRLFNAALNRLRSIFEQALQEAENALDAIQNESKIAIAQMKDIEEQVRAQTPLLIAAAEENGINIVDQAVSRLSQLKVIADSVETAMNVVISDAMQGVQGLEDVAKVAKDAVVDTTKQVYDGIKVAEESVMKYEQLIQSVVEGVFGGISQGIQISTVRVYGDWNSAVGNSTSSSNSDSDSNGGSLGFELQANFFGLDVHEQFTIDIGAGISNLKKLLRDILFKYSFEGIGAVCSAVDSIL